MRILPVLDLMGRQVVRGIGGQRDQYRPIVSALAANSQAETVARAFRELGLNEVYIADLDAIAGGAPDAQSYAAIAAAGLRLHVDAGLRNADDARNLLSGGIYERALASVVVGLETVAGPSALEHILRLVDPQRIIFSLDLRSGAPLYTHDGWSGKPIGEIARIVVQIGVKRLIVLDLSSVGRAAGVSTEALCQRLRAQWPQIELIAGGGVRTAADARRLADCGCDAVLVASALHDGTITAQDIVALHAR